jgi:hypothetical protein
MNFDRFAGIFAASAICLTLAIVSCTGVIGPIWRATNTATPDQWLGFAGAILGAVATPLAAGLALFAAIKTLSPMRAQLDQLIKQNDHVQYERMRKRAYGLNSEIILLQQVCTSCVLADRMLAEFLEKPKHPQDLAFKTAVKAFTDDLEKLRVARGFLWGDPKIQAARHSFVETTASAATLAMAFEDIMSQQAHVAVIVIRRDLEKWTMLNSAVSALGTQLQIDADSELTRIGQIISELEIKLFA